MPNNPRKPGARVSQVPSLAGSPPPREVPPPRDTGPTSAPENGADHRALPYVLSGAGLCLVLILALAMALRQEGGFGKGTSGSGQNRETQSSPGVHGSDGSSPDDAGTSSGAGSDKGLAGGLPQHDDEADAGTAHIHAISTDREDTQTEVDQNAVPVAAQDETMSDHDGRAQDAASVPTASDNVQSFSTFGGIKTPSASITIQGESDGDGEGTIEFFGVEGKGSQIVYVIDMSGSMVGYRFERARGELLESVRRLNGEQSFCILLFHSQMVAPMGVQLARANAATKRNTRLALSQLQAFGGTDPTEAVQAAISLRPDVIYVLSDGDFEPGAVPAVASMNHDSGIVINTIGFQIDARTLRQIARENRGEYRFIP